MFVALLWLTLTATYAAWVYRDRIKLTLQVYRYTGRIFLMATKEQLDAVQADVVNLELLFTQQGPAQALVSDDTAKLQADKAALDAITTGIADGIAKLKADVGALS